jgi:hypothetical protein
MSSFTTPLYVEPMPDGQTWMLHEEFDFYVGDKDNNIVIHVPTGRLTDFASIPKFLFFLPFWSKFQKGAIIHDELYRIKKLVGKPITRKIADDIFLEAMLVDFPVHHKILGKFMAYLEYWAVRIFGWMSWK